MIRTVYTIEGITTYGELKFRRLARNKRTAEKIAKQYNVESDGIFVEITAVPRVNMRYVNLSDVEG